ncbi:hypothetical protein, partial [Acetobacter malorum]|uniref:hypothetical protein n=1 Tax=Acetobacter malorum TaxID=178901 RepID=UPI001E3CBB5E
TATTEEIRVKRAITDQGGRLQNPQSGKTLQAGHKAHSIGQAAFHNIKETGLFYSNRPLKAAIDHAACL